MRGTGKAFSVKNPWYQGLFALAWGTCLTVSILARVKPFWSASRLMKVSLLGSAAVLLTVLAILFLHICLRKHPALTSKTTLISILSALAFGILTSALITPSISSRPVSHTLTVTVPEAKDGRSVVEILEIRDYNGRVILPDAFQREGNWEAGRTGLVKRGGQPAKLSYQYSGPATGPIAVLLKKQPEGGVVVFKIDGRETSWNLWSQVPDNTLVQLQSASLLPFAFSLTDIIAATCSFLFLLIAISHIIANPIRMKIRWTVRGEVWQSIEKRYNYVFAAVLILLMLLPLINAPINTPDFDKRFWGRDFFLQTYTYMRYKIFGDLVFKDVMVSDKTSSWLIYSGDSSLDDFQNAETLSEADLETFQRKMDTLNARLKAKGIQLQVVIVPNKNTIYPEYMPRQIPKFSGPSRLEQLVAYEKDHGDVKVLDLTPVLKNARKENQIYFSTDSHWNPLGAYLGYQAMLNALKANLPVLAPHPLSDFEITKTSGLRGDLGKLALFPVRENSIDLKPKFSTQVKTSSLTTPDGASITITQIPDSTFPRMVMYRDSFANALVPFLSNHFSRAVFLWKANVDMQFIEGEKPDVVIVEYTERYFWKLLLLPD